jgi:hypothetical protein
MRYSVSTPTWSGAEGSGARYRPSPLGGRAIVGLGDSNE